MAWGSSIAAAFLPISATRSGSSSSSVIAAASRSPRTAGSKPSGPTIGSSSSTIPAPASC